MAQNIFGDNKNLVYFGFFSIVITFASGFLGVLGLIVPVIVSAALVLIIAKLSYKAYIIYGILIALGAWVTYADIINTLFFLFNVAAIAVPIGIGIKKKHEFKSFMLNSIICLSIVMTAALIYNTMQAALPITVDNVIDTFLKPSIEAVEFFKQNSDPNIANNINFDEVIVMFRNMSIGIIVAIVIIEVFVTYLFTMISNRYISVIKENMMYPLYNFKISKIGAILYIIAVFITFFNTEGDFYLAALNFYIIMQFPMALCGISAVYKLMGMYKLKKKTIRIIITLIIVFIIMPVFNLLGSMAFVGALNCVLDISNINPQKKA
jgi:hypothetical protein